MKKIIKNKTFIIIILSICLGFYGEYYFLVKGNTHSLPGMTKVIEKMSRKTITSEAIVNKLKEKQELIVMEAELEDQVMLDDSWGNFEVFKKITYINFTGKGIYTVDLSKMESSNINIAQDSKVIYIKLPKPVVKSINIEENKTTYKTEKGLLRFGEIKLTSAENGVVTSKAKERMNEKLLEPSNMSKAEEISKKSLTEIIDNILNENNKYSLVISFY
ncbi:DUF4230 domain-containing protein [Clostridium sp. MSJ-11]|uniref:DUF4230 domain-containing protein n=1 Tax=Clostridium mobile TaxID=2841512 RepID=A0ABS6EN97_9CLOT|nr:DUF4230 domain-containing protein [Clostridium mobile]MBU5486500.1 DUF4230 domain-containing protein [Clostridium mobile]